MKALIRKKNEVILEIMECPYIDWKTGAPLTNPEWAGGPYQLVEDYDPNEQRNDLLKEHCNHC